MRNFFLLIQSYTDWLFRSKNISRSWKKQQKLLAKAYLLNYKQQSEILSPSPHLVQDEFK